MDLKPVFVCMGRTDKDDALCLTPIKNSEGIKKTCLFSGAVQEGPQNLATSTLWIFLLAEIFVGSIG